MKQAIAERISQAFHDWRDAESLALYELPFAPKPNAAKGKDYRTRPQVRDFTNKVIALVEEQLIRCVDAEHVGIRLSWAVVKRTNDMDNCEKLLLDALKNLAFGDDKKIDYVEKVRVPAADKDEECLAIEILEIRDKQPLQRWG